MSFGFGVGDFVAVAQLSWNLYRYCYLVARGAPSDFQLLVQEISTLSQSIKLLEEEAKDPNSILTRAGDDRVRMVKEMMRRVEVTLNELEKYAKKYEKLGDMSRPKRKQIWDKLKWSSEASDLDGLRSRLVYHNGLINLLLTSCGNSSLQRIESTTLKLEKGVNDIKGLIRRSTNDSSSAPPVLSVLDGEKVFAVSFSAKLMKNAEGGRKWSAIGVDEWIQGGRWWLLKSQMGLYAAPSSDGKLPRQGYADLLKASWILIDIITRHPQLSFVESSIQYEVQLLAETIRTELQNIDASMLVRPSFGDLDACDLNIWETQTKEPALQPGKTTLQSGLAQASYESWVTADEHVLFQRFGNYQSNRYAIPTPCIVLFLVHKKDAKARIVLRDQSWVTLATFIVLEMSPHPVSEFLHIEDQKIKFSTPEDAKHLAAISEAVKEYLLYFNRDDNDPETIQVLTLLFSIKNFYWDLVRRLLGNKNSDDMEANPSGEKFPFRLRMAAETLASESVSRAFNGGSNNPSVFCWAVGEGYDTIAALLLEGKKIFTNKEEFAAWSCLINAGRNGQMDVVKLILSIEFADATVKNLKLRKAFYLAACNGHEELVKELLDMGIVEFQDDFPELPVAAKAGYEAIIIMLLKAGANVNVKTVGDKEGGHTALQAAIRGGHETIVGILLNAGADINADPAPYDGRTALQAAAGRGHKAMVGRFLKAGADVNAQAGNVGGRTALQAAAEEGNLDVAWQLIEADADVNAEPAYEGYTALQAAAAGGHGTIVDQLLKAGADVNAEPAENKGYTALQAAAAGGHGTVVDQLLKAGADVNAKPAYEGYTALQAAAAGGHGTIVDQLLKAGADVNAEPAYGGYTALQAAAAGGHGTVVDQLLKASADVNAEPADEGYTALQAAAAGGHETAVDQLLKAGADVNAEPAYEGYTALQAAAAGRHETVVDQLLKAGADVNAKPATYKGYTALQAAAAGGHGTVVDQLLKAGADVNAEPATYKGYTALQAAAAGGHETAVDQLLKAGADVNAKQEYTGQTALKAALQSGNKVIVLMLENAGAK